MKKVCILITLALISPVFVFAQNDARDLPLLGTLIPQFGNLVGKLTTIVFAVALLVFFWGVAKYIFLSGSEEAKARGKRIMTGGIIALFIMVSIWGIVEFIRKDFGISDDKTIGVPRVKPQ
ncbi:MAG: hypothetical protein A3G52_00230 [Candidatus Taylorbacteria bacterium RIFCSPLOWO2_12_FULL_43_20]|uniref:Uncharacterized protein n=1 Tax=Candidatus Taylorbacteria bacterium RIFCSPLOWO2_12_FULL_43_20 TaxID=1802332 RepID=A0A1G2P380_9BACT|nr:MAG: hypothetical protein A2825_01625 [Candidatus Taylorbacteria bacterium RIFCSPHIGHO2_01_FULL_43_120]OHA23107.1 MAG: hypothetical protein A3B98_03580 [Candidatus Taylorbacteria bacterium RIFCSPHIGHO2_02_FULL_43_55]OHA28912.1 MAG: hypothetical protein A3E92_04550 [Candidatus Taylorbacteria bacterium RIFCSPHIGHO2_12_FULL_42_34]OHA30896.1 MAG: hypothetical protein A3B09_04500 [Candidatus Taylorbacteria bacterium RIFCSPLOWO2_01_FULL_43_83]OHA39310.1 MAG: hypothetical protein A3H58_03960 [Candi